MEFSIDLNAVLQAILIASVLFAGRKLWSSLGEIQEKLSELVTATEVQHTEIEHVKKELSHHNRRLEHVERRNLGEAS